MKKKLLSILLALGMIISCAGCTAKNSGSGKDGSEKISKTRISKTEPEDPDPSDDPSESTTDPSSADSSEKDTFQLSFTRETFPRIRYSYTTYPFAAALATVLIGMDRGETNVFLDSILWDDSVRDELVLTNDYDASYRTNDSFDEYDKEVIAKDALVFIVNKDNPVDSLTGEQLKKIYKGEIKNWKEVGGKDQKIRAFENGVNAVSQKMLEDMVVGGSTKVESPYFLASGDDYYVYKARKTYDNETSSIGFVQYSCLKDISIRDQIKILKIDGVAADEGTISKGEYPYSFNEYVMMPHTTPEKSSAGSVYAWILSEEGKTLLQKEGYILPSDGSFTKDASFIKTNWDAYREPQSPEDVFTRASEEPIKEFTASEEYGKIYPFLGADNETLNYEGEHLYGFVDENGKIICDPVFNGFGRLDDGSYTVWQYVTDSKSDNLDYRCGVISADGSMFTGLIYHKMYKVDGQLYFYNVESDRITIFSYDAKTGKTSSGKQLKMNTDMLYSFYTVVDERYVVTCDFLGGGNHVYDGTTGKDVFPEINDDGYLYVCNNVLLVVDPQIDYRLRLFSIDGNPINEKEYREEPKELPNGTFLVEDGKNQDFWDLIGKDGKILGSIDNKDHTILDMEVSDDYIIAVKEASIDLYDLELHLLKTVETEKNTSCYVLTPPSVYFTGEEMTRLPSDPIVEIVPDDRNPNYYHSKALLNLKTEAGLTFESDFNCDIMGSRILLRDTGDRNNEGAKWKILDSSDFHVISEGTGYVEAIEDKATHEFYLVSSLTDTSAEIKVLSVEDGKVVFEDLPNPEMNAIRVTGIEDGKIMYSTERQGILWTITHGVTIMEKDGKVLFHYTPFVLPK